MRKVIYIYIFYTCLGINTLPKVICTIYILHVHLLVETFWKDYFLNVLKACIFVCVIKTTYERNMSKKCMQMWSYIFNWVILNYYLFWAPLLPFININMFEDNLLKTLVFLLYEYIYISWKGYVSLKIVKCSLWTECNFSLSTKYSKIQQFNK